MREPEVREHRFEDDGRILNNPEVASRFYRWREAGVWGRVPRALHRENVVGKLDWEMHHVGFTTVRAHQHAAGSERDQEAEAPGRGRGGFSTKVHLTAERGGKPVAYVLTAGQRHEAVAFEALVKRGAEKRQLLPLRYPRLSLPSRYPRVGVPRYPLSQR